MNGNLMFCESAYGSLEELQVLGFVFLEHWLFAYIWQEMTLQGPPSPACHDRHFECHLVDRMGIEMFGAQEEIYLVYLSGDSACKHCG